MKLAWVVIILFLTQSAYSSGIIDSFYMKGDVKVTIDAPNQYQHTNSLIILYALPNGNTTEQTMGRKITVNDNWHYDIQHIQAQTAFLRKTLKNQDIVVVYLENSYKSWPRWKTIHPDYPVEIKHIVDTLLVITPGKHKSICLNGHSGGGSFIFGYLQGLTSIPAYVKRISFLDSNYGYDSSYSTKFTDWLRVPGHYLSVFAYNDSIALYNGKPIVSPTGGTWHKSKMMLNDLASALTFRSTETDSLFIYVSRNKRTQFYLKKNIDKGIYHTQQVEKNGFIHSILCGTRYHELQYRYYGERAYAKYIE